MQKVKNDIASTGSATASTGSGHSLEQHVIQTLVYYDIFNYPLKKEEVYFFLGINSVTVNDVADSLNTLAERKVIYRYGEFYSMQDKEENIHRRIKGNREAEKFLDLAYKKARLIARFPFVRAVLASGSLSKGYMDEKSDLDFFIITKPGRLWIARMLLVVYKRIFLGNSHKHFCVNYFIDYDHLEIEEKNIFTATELATVIPLYGREYYNTLHESNRWLREFFPNYKEKDTKYAPADDASAFKTFIEKIIDFLLGDNLDEFFMSLTLKRWKKLYRQNYSKQDFDIAFKTRKHASKNHPQHYQQKVTALYEKKLNEFAAQFNWKWHA